VFLVLPVGDYGGKKRIFFGSFYKKKRGLIRASGHPAVSDSSRMLDAEYPGLIPSPSVFPLCVKPPFFTETLSTLNNNPKMGFPAKQLRN